MFAAPFSYTLRGMTKLMEWRAPAEPDSAAGISPDTSYPKSGIYRKCPPDSFYDFCPLKLRQWSLGCSSEHRMCQTDNRVPLSKQCSDIKIEPSRDFRKFNDFV